MMEYNAISRAGQGRQILSPASSLLRQNIGQVGAKAQLHILSAHLFLTWTTEHFKCFNILYICNWSRFKM